MEDKGMIIRAITLEDIWETFVKHLIPIILAAVVCASAVFAFDRITYEPRYNSTATLYLLRIREDTEGNTNPDLSMASSLLSDSKYMLRSHTVLDKVISELNLDMSYRALYNAISIANPEGTRVLEVSVKTGSAELSKQVVDCVCHTAAKQIAKATSVDQINFYSEGTLETSPYNTMGITRYLKFGLVAAAAVYALYFVLFLLDDRIKGPEDVEKYLEMSVLGEIPNSNDSKSKKGKYHGYYSKYKYKYGGKYGGKYQYGGKYTNYRPRKSQKTDDEGSAKK